MSSKLHQETSQLERPSEVSRPVAPAGESTQPVEVSTLYHTGSINPTGREGARVWSGFGSKMYFDPEAPDPETYNRGLSGYVHELDGTFKPEEWVGKRVLDIGSGAYDKFGREARQRGIDAVSINPALKDEKQVAYLHEALEHDTEEKRYAERRRFANLPWWRRAFSHMAAVQPEQSMVVNALGQQLPFLSESMDAVVSVYGVPHYLHHVDANLMGDDEAILKAYTPKVREQDKALIGRVFDEIVRVLKPGGKALLTDDYRAPDQTTNLNHYSPSDGTEVVEVLEGLQAQGVTFQITEQPTGSGSIKRVIVLQKPAHNL